jgi:DMSO/TMAO reductase YedYZ molybdopterin-dependent catalytic subunit
MSSRPLSSAEERDLLLAEKPRLIVVEDETLNAETAPADLDAPITPMESFFVRNNGALPVIAAEEAKAWTLTVDGQVERPTTWTLDALKTSFPVVTVTAVMECAGNGRSAFHPVTRGLPWGPGAVGCARWTGVRLRDLLEVVRPKPSAVYTGHFSPDTTTDGSGPAISRGLPMWKALAPETLVAFAMNDAPLTLLHGAPLRIVAPGFPGSAWQKWLSRIAVRDREHDGALMTETDYRLPRRPLRPGDPIDLADLAVLEEIPVKSLVTAPADGFVARPGERIEVRGFAWSGHGPVRAVAVSADGGETWRETELEPAPDRFAWARFRAAVTVGESGPVAILSRATDETRRTQPLDATWNPRGYCNNAAHRVAGTVGACAAA